MARKMILELVADPRQFEAGLKRADRSAQRFGRSMERTFRGTVVGTGVFQGMSRSVAFASSTFLGGVGLTAAIKGSIQAASDLNEQISKTGVVFGASTDQVEAWAQTLADAFGLSQRQALATASSFGALLRPLGLTGLQAAKQSEKLTQLGADLASFYNTDVQDALDAIRSGIVGESEPLRRYGVLLSESRVQQEALIETGKKHANQLTDQDKVLARITLIYKDAGQAQGDFSRTSGGLANQLRIAQANIDNLQIAIGRQLVPMVLKATQHFNKWISQEENQRKIADAVKQGADALVTIFNTLRGAFEGLNKITGSTKNSLELLLEAFVAFKTAKVAASIADIATSFASVSTKAGEAETAVTALSRIGPIAIPVVITIVGQAALRRFLDWAKKSLPVPRGGGTRGGFVPGRPGTWTPEEVAAAAAGIGPQTYAWYLQHPEIGMRLARQSLRAGRVVQQMPPPVPRAEMGGGGGGRGRTWGDWLTPAERAARRNQWFDARLARERDRLQDFSLRKQLAGQKAIEAELRARMAATHDVTRRLHLHDELVTTLRSEKDLEQQITDNIKQGNEALKTRAEAIKSAVVTRLQRVQERIDIQRGIADARTRLRLARQIGAPGMIQQATQEYQDALRQWKIFRAQNAPATLRGGRFQLGNIVTINVHGTDSPEAVAKKVVEIMHRHGRQGVTQARGASAGSIGLVPGPH